MDQPQFDPWQAAVPPVDIQVLLGERMTVSLLGPGSKRRHITITEEQTAGVIGWLALRGKGVWARRQEVMQALGAQDDETITRQISRLNTALNRAVRKMLPPTTNAASKPSLDRGERRLTLIEGAEHEADERETCWRLPVGCDVAFFPEVLSLAQRVRQEQKQATGTLLTADALHAACQRMMKEYVTGLFARYQMLVPTCEGDLCVCPCFL